MDNKQRKLREPTREELAEMIKGIIQEDRDHGHIPPRKLQCNQCIHRIPHTFKCKILYPEWIPDEVLDKGDCKEFKQK